MIWTVSATRTSNATFYVKLIPAATAAEARGAVEAQGFRVDAVEETPAYAYRIAADGTPTWGEAR